MVDYTMVIPDELCVTVVFSPSIRLVFVDRAWILNYCMYVDFYISLRPSVVYFDIPGLDCRFLIRVIWYQNATVLILRDDDVLPCRSVTRCCLLSSSPREYLCFDIYVILANFECTY